MNLRVMLIGLLVTTISFTSIAQNETHRDTLLVKGLDSSDYKIFEKVDIEAKFPGGDAAWRKFLEHNLHGDVPMQNNAPAGVFTVWI